MYTDDIFKEVRKKAKELNETRIFYTLKKMGVKPLRKDTIELVRTLLAFNVAGYTFDGYVTIRMLREAIGTSLNAVRSRCHVLGDKGVLRLKYFKGTSSVILGYKISKEFLDAFKRSKDDNMSTIQEM
jgi:hypothetical protein